VVSHYGEFTGYTVKNFSKLIGKDIIVAHQLLKNDIDQHEYWLVTQSLLRGSRPENLADWMIWNSGAKQTENGDVSYQYTQLSQLRNQLAHAQSLPFDLSKKIKMISVTQDYPIDIITLFHASGDSRYRGRWQEGVKHVQELHHYLPRLGMRCRCILHTGEEFTYASSYYQYQDNRIEFAESNEKDQSILYFTLEVIETKKTRLTFDYYLAKNILSEISFRLTRKKKMLSAFKKSLENLTDVVKELKIPTARV
jgi:hypothetical protein